MQKIRLSVLRRLPLVACLAAIGLGACGDGGGGGRRLEGNDAVEAAVGVTVATVRVLPAFLFDLTVEEDAPAGDPALARGTGAGGTEVACAGGGTKGIRCAVDERGEATLEVDYRDCREGDAPARRRDGSLTIEALDPALCASGAPRDDLPFAVELSGFSSVLTGEDGAELARLTADLRESVVPVPGGCFTRDGTRIVSGTFTLASASLGVDLSVTADELGFEIASLGTPCEQRVASNGTLAIDDHQSGQRFSQTFDEALFVLAAESDTTLLSASGRLSNSCLGELTFASEEALRLDDALGCPAGGALRLAFADGGEGAFRFTAAGGVEIDFTADGIADRSVASCDDASLPTCR